jgi:hypothetical protein
VYRSLAAVEVLVDAVTIRRCSASPGSSPEQRFQQLLLQWSGPAAGWPSMAVILGSQHQEGQAGDEDELAKRGHES